MSKNLFGRNLILKLLVFIQTLSFSNWKKFAKLSVINADMWYKVMYHNIGHRTVKVFLNAICSSRAVFTQSKQIVMTASTKHNTSDWRRQRRCLYRLSSQQTRPHFQNWHLSPVSVFSIKLETENTVFQLLGTYVGCYLIYEGFPNYCVHGFVWTVLKLITDWLYIACKQLVKALLLYFFL